DGIRDFHVTGVQTCALPIYFVNSDAVRVVDALRDFETLMAWLEAATLVDAERGLGMRRRAREQPSGAAAALVDARRVRGALRVRSEERRVGKGCASRGGTRR